MACSEVNFTLCITFLIRVLYRTPYLVWHSVFKVRVIGRVEISVSKNANYVCW